MPIDVEIIYQKSVDAVIHCYKAIVQIRAIALVQGLVIIGAATYAKQNGSISQYSDPILLFGICFTIVLWRQQSNFLNDYKDHVDTLKAIDERDVEIAALAFFN